MIAKDIQNSSWKKFSYRKPTKDEVAYCIRHYGYEITYLMDGEWPKDLQEIFVTDGVTSWRDTFHQPHKDFPSPERLFAQYLEFYPGELKPTNDLWWMPVLELPKI